MCKRYVRGVVSAASPAPEAYRLAHHTLHACNMLALHLVQIANRAHSCSAVDHEQAKAEV